MVKIYFVKDNKTGWISEVWTNVNLTAMVRDIRALCDQDAVNRHFVRLNRWNDSVLYELSGDEKNGFKVTGTYKLDDVTGLKKDPIRVTNRDVVEDHLKDGKN